MCIHTHTHYFYNKDKSKTKKKSTIFLVISRFLFTEILSFHFVLPNNYHTIFLYFIDYAFPT